jgi:16S rRNA U516 pseudouridylate synthase RsuA-like enzyme
VVAAREKPFCCPVCFRRLQSEADGRNHFRDKHGRGSLFAPEPGAPDHIAALHQRPPTFGSRNGAKKAARARQDPGPRATGDEGASTGSSSTDGPAAIAEVATTTAADAEASTTAAAAAAAAVPAAGTAAAATAKALDVSHEGLAAARASGYRFGPLVVAFEDDHFAVVVKPQGIATLGEAESLARDGVLTSALKPSPLFDGLRKGLPVHRLDAPTGGLVMVGKAKTAVTSLCVALQERRVRKRYRAVVAGALTAGDEGGGEGGGWGTMDGPIKGASALTRFRVVGLPTHSARFGCVTTVDLWPVTGRKHQLRRHLAAKGHPIVGDTR